MRFLPTQQSVRELFDGDDAALHQEIYRAIVSYAGLREPNHDFKLELSDQVEFDLMGSPPAHLKFLEILVRIAQPRRVLEIGAFIGMSAMAMARGLPEGGTITTIEKYEHFAGIATTNFKLNSLHDRIRLLLGEGIDKLQELLQEKNFQPFDFVFLDGDKGQYPEYFRLLDEALRPGGLLVVDDVFFTGDVFNPVQKTEKGRGVRKFLEDARDHDGYHKVILPTGDGIMLLIKK